MTTKKKLAIVLGGTSPHIELIKNLKNRGYSAILLDYLDNPPAAEYADEHIKESTLDYDKVYEIAKEKQADLVISTCIDQANITACYVSEKLGLYTPYSFETALDVTNKMFMKNKMTANSIPTSRYICVTDASDYDISSLTFPLVVKPVDCNGSKGVRKAYNAQEVAVYVKDAMELSRTDNAIVEEFKNGMEIQIDCHVCNNQTQIIMVRQKRKITGESGDELQSVGSIVPPVLSDKLTKEIPVVAQKIAKAFCLENTPFFIQAIVSGDEINVIEFAPRIGGGLSYSMLKVIAGVDMVDVAVDSFLNVKRKVTPRKTDYVYATNLIYANKGIFNNISGYEKLFEEGLIEEFYTMKLPGTEIDGGLASKNRVGAFLIKAKSQEELREKINRANDLTDVFDENNNSIMNKEIYQNEIIYQ